MNNDLTASLKKYFGFSQFKGEQQEIINSLLNKEDVFVLMPTGGGKSLCYQLPALISDGVAIIVSPLIALMKNQVDALRGISSENGIAHVLNSSLNKTETKIVMDDIRSGVTKMLYVAPESLTKEEYTEFFKTVKISFFAIDEAHCISEWGHDFRPEYRNLKHIINKIGDAPVIALTATATPKVQEDIQKTLGMQKAKVYKASFNRPNLFYEIRPKVNQDKEIVKFISQFSGQSGVIYCLSRKKVEEFSQTLQVNGIKAIPYHAGLDGKTRSKHQDMFLMEDVDVVVATIAFGMGIDKPDVRFVIHYDMPKSLESYYQETGRAGRDGGVGHCLAFYDYKDIEKLEKFLAGKHVAEREVGLQLLSEVVAYSETSMSRRKFLLHYFGEEFDEENGLGANMDDNMRNPKKMIDVQDDAKKILEVIQKNNQRLKINDIVNILTGKESSIIKSYNLHLENYFGSGKDQEDYHWKSIVRQLIVRDFLIKEIETYGTLKLNEKGKEFLKKQEEFLIAEDIDFKKLLTEGSSEPIQTAPAAFDDTLLKHLKDLRKKIAKQHGIPPFAVFQDPSLDDMTMQYPTTIKELTNVFGVGEGKANKFGKSFVDFIAKYVEENDIVRPDEMVIKSVADKSSFKVYIIQSVDRKLNLEDMAKAKSLSMTELLSEMESIVYQGTKLNIDYYIEDILDEDQQEEIHDYLMEAQSDSMTEMLKEFKNDYDEEELRLMRIKFINDIAN
ncbi:DNA helicase RecQ [Moheibacter sediminis]|uniref:DNA helicase RecQ n=1 Tax=Moheibacter sediminis TaxID=1434700 RepID=A0A1W1ZMX0_9FLAO|nr:ATP-dependent DNA helicase RecQ [Moheibacter sediminis]